MCDEHSKASDPAVGSTRLVRRVWRRMWRDPGSEKCKCGHVRNSHGQDLPWARCGNTTCKHDHCECQAFTPNDRGQARRDNL